MVRIIESMPKWINVILSGKTIADKFALLNYTFSVIFGNPHLSRNIIIKTDSGVLFEVRKNKLKEDLWALTEYIEPEVYAYLKTQDIKTFVDIGANVGKYSSFISRLFPKSGVFAFEPEKENFEQLWKNMELNNGSRNIELFNLACYFKKKELKLFLSETNDGIHSLSFDAVKHYGTKKKKVEIIQADTLDNMILDKVIKVDVIKVDIEGAELDALKGAVKIIERDHPQIIFEAWSWKPENLENITAFLNSYNYRITNLGGENYLAT